MMTSKKECEMLMNELLPVAEKMLKQYGEFYPYGGYIELGGNIVHVGAKDSHSDHPKSRDLIRTLEDSFRELAIRGRCKAIAIVFDVTTTLPKSSAKSDAIQVSLEHKDGYSVQVFFPYEVSDGQLIYKSSFAEEGEHRFFASVN